MCSVMYFMGYPCDKLYKNTTSKLVFFYVNIAFLSFCAYHCNFIYSPQLCRTFNPVHFNRAKDIWVDKLNFNHSES